MRRLNRLWLAPTYLQTAQDLFCRVLGARRAQLLHGGMTTASIGLELGDQLLGDFQTFASRPQPRIGDLPGENCLIFSQCLREGSPTHTSSHSEAW